MFHPLIACTGAQNNRTVTIASGTAAICINGIVNTSFILPSVISNCGSNNLSYDKLGKFNSNNIESQKSNLQRSKSALSIKFKNNNNFK